MYIKVDKCKEIPRNDTIARSAVLVYIIRTALTTGNTPLRYIYYVIYRTVRYRYIVRNLALRHITCYTTCHAHQGAKNNYQTCQYVKVLVR